MLIVCLEKSVENFVLLPELIKFDCTFVFNVKRLDITEGVTSFHVVSNGRAMMYLLYSKPVHMLHQQECYYLMYLLQELNSFKIPLYNLDTAFFTFM